MAELNLNITTPAKIIFSGSIKSIIVPGTDGSFQVLKNHAPIMSTFEIGLVKIEFADNTTEYYATGGGTIEVKENKVILLADSIEKSDEIDTDRATEAMNRAKRRLGEKTTDKTIDVARAQAALARAGNRLKVVEKYLYGIKGKP